MTADVRFRAKMGDWNNTIHLKVENPRGADEVDLELTLETAADLYAKLHMCIREVSHRAPVKEALASLPRIQRSYGYDGED